MFLLRKREKARISICECVVICIHFVIRCDLQSINISGGIGMGNPQNSGENLPKFISSEDLHIFLNDADRREKLLLVKQANSRFPVFLYF